MDEFNFDGLLNEMTDDKAPVPAHDTQDSASSSDYSKFHVDVPSQSTTPGHEPTVEPQVSTTTQATPAPTGNMAMAVQTAPAPDRTVTQTPAPQDTVMEKEAARAQQLADSLGARDAANIGAMSTAFFDALPKDKQEKVYALGGTYLKQFLEDNMSITDFGQSALAGVNAIIDKMIAANDKNAHVDEVTQLLADAQANIQGYVRDYKEEIDLEGKEDGKILSWFKNKKRKAQDVAFKRQPVLDQINSLETQMIAKREVMRQSFAYVHQLLEENQKAGDSMVGYLAAMEAIHMRAITIANALRKELAATSKDSPDYQNIADKLADVAEVCNMLEMNHTNYMARLAVSWATSSQIRNLQRVSTTVTANISQVVTYTIPIMKQSIAQIGIINATRDASKATEAIKSANDSLTNMLIDLQTKELPNIERKAQAPVISADTIEALTKGVEDANQALVDAINQGNQARRDVEKAVMAANERIKESDNIRDKELIDAMIDSKNEEGKVNSEFENAYHRNTTLDDVLK